jgi:peptidoglycan/LPS O-acetylase OafA/YrhL
LGHGSYRPKVDEAAGAFATSASYVPALDGLRAVSIALVVIGHSGFERKVPAGFGVTLFFFISGFLIARLLLMELRRDGGIDLPRFYFMRFLRLMPALYLYVAVAGCAFAVVGFAISPLHYSAALFYWANYFGVYFSNVYNGFAAPPHVDMQNPFTVLWSLAVEEHFYFLFPALLLFFAKRLPTLLRVLALLCLAALMWRCVFTAWHCGDPLSCEWAQYYNERASDTRFDNILYGVIATMLLYLAPERFLAAIRKPTVVIAAFALLFSAFALRDPMFRATLRYSIEGLALTVIVPAILYAPLGLPARRILSYRPMLYVGRLSYTLYLFHWLARNLASYAAPSYSAEWYAIFIAGTLVTTLLCYHFVEMPIVAVRRRFGSSAPAQAIPRAAPETVSAPAYGSTTSRDANIDSPFTEPAPIKLVDGSRSWKAAEYQPSIGSFEPR